MKNFLASTWNEIRAWSSTEWILDGAITFFLTTAIWYLPIPIWQRVALSVAGFLAITSGIRFVNKNFDRLQIANVSRDNSTTVSELERMLGLIRGSGHRQLISQGILEAKAKLVGLFPDSPQYAAEMANIHAEMLKSTDQGFMADNAARRSAECLLESMIKHLKG